MEEKYEKKFGRHVIKIKRFFVFHYFQTNAAPVVLGQRHLSIGGQANYTTPAI